MTIIYQVDGQERFITFDAAITETHSSSAEVTQRNVEKGANITDHVRPAQDRLSVEAVITNAPIVVPESSNTGISGSTKKLELSGTSSASVLQFDSKFNRVRDVYDELVDIVSTPRIVSVDTGIRAYNDMVIVNLSAPRTIEDSIHFSFEAVKIRFVESRTVDLAPTKTKRKKKGHQAPKKVKKDGPEESVLHRIVN